MDKQKKINRYNRLCIQIAELLNKCSDETARMATVSAVLYHKMDFFSWCGFYRIRKGELIVGAYQGPVACQVLQRNTGVCWASVNQRKTIIVPDVHKFPGHIACDSRSKSEIVIPYRSGNGRIKGVLDIDSAEYGAFDETDAKYLEKIVTLL